LQFTIRAPISCTTNHLVLCNSLSFSKALTPRAKKERSCSLLLVSTTCYLVGVSLKLICLDGNSKLNLYFSILFIHLFLLKPINLSGQCLNRKGHYYLTYWFLIAYLIKHHRSINFNHNIITWSTKMTSRDISFMTSKARSPSGLLLVGVFDIYLISLLYLMKFDIFLLLTDGFHSFFKIYGFC